MSKRKPTEAEPEGMGVTLTQTERVARIAKRHVAEERRRGRRGPDADPDSLRSKVAEGAARFLKVALPTEMHRRLHVMSVEQDRTVSDLVTEALEAHYRLRQ